MILHWFDDLAINMENDAVKNQMQQTMLMSLMKLDPDLSGLLCQNRLNSSHGSIYAVFGSQLFQLCLDHEWVLLLDYLMGVMEVDSLDEVSKLLDYSHSHALSILPAPTLAATGRTLIHTATYVQSVLDRGYTLRGDELWEYLQICHPEIPSIGEYARVCLDLWVSEGGSGDGMADIPADGIQWLLEVAVGREDAEGVHSILQHPLCLPLLQSLPLPHWRELVRLSIMENHFTLTKCLFESCGCHSQPGARDQWVDLVFLDPENTHLTNYMLSHRAGSGAETVALSQWEHARTLLRAVQEEGVGDPNNSGNSSPGTGTGTGSGLSREEVQGLLFACAGLISPWLVSELLGTARSPGVFLALVELLRVPIRFSHCGNGDGLLHIICRNGWMQLLPRFIQEGLEYSRENQEELLVLGVPLSTRLQLRVVGVNDPNAAGETPLLVCPSARGDLMGYLMQHGSNLHPPRGGEPLLHLLAVSNSLVGVQLMLSHTAAAATSAAAAVYAHMCDAGDCEGCVEGVGVSAPGGTAAPREEDIHTRDSQGNTVLHALLLHGDMGRHQGFRDMFALLVSLGARVNAVNCNQCTPLYLAVQRRNEVWVRLLLSCGDISLDPDPRSTAPTPFPPPPSPLQVCMWEEYDSGAITELLLQHGADPTAPIRPCPAGLPAGPGWASRSLAAWVGYPLYFACNTPGTVRLLLRYHPHLARAVATVGGVDWTVLYRLVSGECAGMYISHGADVHHSQALPETTESQPHSQPQARSALQYHGCTLREDGRPGHLAVMAVLLGQGASDAGMMLWDEELAPGKRVFTQLFIGFPGMGSDVHAAIGCNFFRMISGRKRWWVIP